MAFLLRLRTIHTFTNPSRSLSLLHHHRLLTTSNSGAGDLLRLRTFHSLTNPSLLHHHRRLFSTSNSNTSHPFLSSLTKIQTFLLHHLRLLSNSDTGAGDHPNSDQPSPSLVKEVREAFKQLAESEVLLEPFISTLPFELPSPPFSAYYSPMTYKPSPDHQNAPPRESSNSNPTYSLVHKLEHLKASALSLNQRLGSDRQRLSELFEPKMALNEEINEMTKMEFREIRESRMGLLQIDMAITNMTRHNEMTKKICDLALELSNSRLSSNCEIVKNLYQLMEDWPQHKELWIELKNSLWTFQEKESKGFKLLAVDTKLQLGILQHRINYLFELRDNNKEG